MMKLMMYAPLLGAMVLTSGCLAESAIECNNADADAEELEGDASLGGWDDPPDPDEEKCTPWANEEAPPSPAPPGD